MPGIGRTLAAIVVMLGAISHNGTAQAVAMPDKPVDNTVANPGADQAVAKEIQPHRALYTLSLASARNGSNVSDATGKMFFEWADNCDGWAVQQRVQLHFGYAEGDESDISTTSLSWESKDGNQYNFNVKRLADGEETEQFRGKATINPAEKTGRGLYQIPKGKEVKLEPNTLFPAFHTRMILDNAAKGTKFFSRRVFDGSDAEGQADISAFIGKQIEANTGTEMNPALKQNPLLMEPAWPVRLAFFKPQAESEISDYEMQLTLLANGVVHSMVIDYGDFALTGVLSSLEALPVPKCQTP